MECNRKRIAGQITSGPHIVAILGNSLDDYCRYIDVPPKLVGYDIIAEMIKKNAPIPPSMGNYVKNHNFYYVS